MMGKIVGACTGTILLFLLSCTSPKDPWKDPKNASADVVLPTNAGHPLSVGDTVKIGAALNLAAFFDSVRISVGDYWDTSLAVKTEAGNDTLWVSCILQKTGQTTILVTGYVEGGLTREKSGSINVTGLTPKFIRNLAPVTTVTAGKPLTLSISATGTAPLHYQWLHSGTVLTADTLSSLTRVAAQQLDTGVYLCIISNSWGRDTSNPGAVLVYPAGTPDAPQGLHVVSRAAGTLTLSWSSVTGSERYNVYRDMSAGSGVASLGHTLDTAFSTRDTGRFYYWVTTVISGIESPASTPVLVAPIDTSAPRSAPHWVRDSLQITVSEGDSFAINLADSCIDTNKSPLLQISMLNRQPRGGISGLGRYTVHGGYRDSGTYRDSVLAVDGTLKDTIALTVKIRAVFCTLSVFATNGQVAVTPSVTVFRWSDTVGLSATPNPGYEFSSWSGDAGGTNFAITLVMNKSKSVTALFTKLPDCTAVPQNGSINQLIAQHRTAANRPTVICPAPGLYDNGTIKIDGLVKFTIQ